MIKILTFFQRKANYLVDIEDFEICFVRRLTERSVFFTRDNKKLGKKQNFCDLLSKSII